MDRPFAVLIAGLCLVAASCASQRAAHKSPHVGTAAMWRDFQGLPEARAIALAGDPERIWVGAAVGNAPSQESADAAAMSECKRRRRVGRMQARCAIYARGESLVWDERREDASSKR